MSDITEYYVLRRCYDGEGERRKIYFGEGEARDVFGRLVAWINATGNRPTRGIILLEHVVMAQPSTIAGNEMARELLSAACLRPRADYED